MIDLQWPKPVSKQNAPLWLHGMEKAQTCAEKQHVAKIQNEKKSQ